MRILYLSPEYSGVSLSGGLGTFTATMAAAMSARGHDVHVLVCEPGLQPRDECPGGDDGVQVHFRRVPMPPWPSPLPRLWETRLRLLSAISFLSHYWKLGERFHLVHAPEYMGPAVLLAPFTKALVVRLSGPLGLILECEGEKVGRDERFADRLERWAANQADLLVSPSAKLGQLLCERSWARAEARTLPTPVATSDWENTSDAGATAPVVLAVGKLSHSKGADLVLEAAAKLLGEVPDLRVIFVGRPSSSRQGRPYNEFLAERAAELGVPCSLVGEQPRGEVRKYYQMARVTVMASRFEAWGNAGMEAMAAARPLVCTSACGVSEVVERVDPEAVAAPDDPAALADALRPYLVSPERAAQMGRQGQELVRAHYSPAAVAEALEALYTEAVASARPRISRLVGRR